MHFASIELWRITLLYSVVLASLNRGADLVAIMNTMSV